MRKPRFPRTCRLLLGVAILTTGASFAEDAPDADLIRDLTAAYAAHQGYLATYHSEKPGAALDVTIGLDEASGVAVARMIATAGGMNHEMRQWCDAKGVFYYAAGDDLYRLDMDAVGRGLLRDFREMVDVRGLDSPAPVPSLGLDRKTIGLSVNPGAADEPFWAAWLKDAALKETNDETATFLTKERGEVTIQRATGMLAKQALASETGEMRVLELKDFQPNPGQGAVTNVFRTWETAGAEPLDHTVQTKFRIQFILAMVEAVDRGDVKLADFQQFVREKNNSIASFVASGIVTTEGSLAADPAWDRMLDKQIVLDNFRRAAPEGAKVDMEEMERKLGTQEGRDMFFGNFVVSLLNREGAREKALGEFLGIQAAVEIPAETADGREAATTVANAIAHAYYSAIVDRKVRELWGPPEAP